MIPFFLLFLIYIHFSQFTFHNYNNTVHCSISNKKNPVSPKEIQDSYIYNVTMSLLY